MSGRRWFWSESWGMDGVFPLTANLKTESILNEFGEFVVVYCSKCGTQNPDDAKVCSNCGAPLYAVGAQYPGSDREHYRHVEGECFGLPNGGMIVGIIVGIIIVFVGLGLFLQASGYAVNFAVFWPIIIVIFGVLIILGALYGRRRWERR